MQCLAIQQKAILLSSLLLSQTLVGLLKMRCNNGGDTTELFAAAYGVETYIIYGGCLVLSRELLLIMGVHNLTI